MPTKVVILTHGNPTKFEDCGRPVGRTRVEGPIAYKYACPVHGLLDPGLADSAIWSYLMTDELA